MSGITEYYYNLRSLIHLNLNVPVYSEATYENQNVEVPCVIFSRQGVLGTQTMSGPSVRTETVIFAAKAKTIEQADSMRDLIIQILNGYSAEIQIVVNSEQDDFDVSTGLYSREISFDVTYGAEIEYYNPVIGSGVASQIAIWKDKYIISASNALTVTGSNVQIEGNLNIVGQLNLTGSVSSASYAVSSSFATTASYVNGNSISSSFATTASYVNKALSTLSDVTLTSPQTGELLAYDSSSAKWINTKNLTASFAIDSLRVIGQVTSSKDISVNGTTIGRGTGNVLGNLAVGYRALDSNSGLSDGNTAIGSQVLKNNTRGLQNTGVGSGVLINNISGSDNTAIGYLAMQQNSSGSKNIAVGSLSLLYNTSGSQNIVVGYYSGTGIVTGSNNVIIGNNVTSSGEISNNVIIADGSGNIRMRISSSGHTTFDSPITASLSGTASYASQAVTASFVATAQTASYISWSGVAETTTDTFLGTASYAQQAATASFVALAQSASYVLNAKTASFVDTAQSASYVTYSNVKNISSSSSFAGTASYATQALTASYALNGVLPANVVSSSAQISNGGGTALGASNNVTVGQITASAANITNAVIQNLSVQYITSSVVVITGSNKFGDEMSDVQEFTGSVRMTGSLNVVGPITGTASYALQAATASFVTLSQTSSYVVNAISASYIAVAQTASYVVLAQTASYVANAQSASYVVNAISSSYAATAATASFVTWSNVQESSTDVFLGTASYATVAANAQTSSYVVNAISASFATTASYAMNGGVISSSFQLSNGGGYAFSSSNNVTFGQITGSSDAIINGVTVGRGKILYTGVAATNNTAVGYQTLRVNVSGSEMTAIGYNAMPNQVSGYRNTAVGQGALGASTTAFTNTAVGDSAHNSVTTAYQNVAVGNSAGQSLTTGVNNVSVGSNTHLDNRTGTSNTIVGSFAGRLNKMDNNTMLGASAGYLNVSGSRNTFIGNEAGYGIVTGSANTILGYTTRGQFDTSSNYSNNIIISDGDGNIRMRVSSSGHTTFDSPVTASVFGTSSYALQTLSASYVANATTASYLLGDASSSYIQFSQPATVTTQQAKLQWDSGSGTFEFGVGSNTPISSRISQDIFSIVRNVDTTEISKGDVVYLFGASGDKPSVKKASNLSDATSAKTFGVAAENIAVNAFGIVTTVGILTGLNLGSYTAGDILYVGTATGSLTNTKPQAPLHTVFVGIVNRANAGNGIMYVKPQNGYELDELHDVQIISASYGQTLIYSSSYWINSNELNITGSVLGTSSFATTAANAKTASYISWSNVAETTTDTFLGTASFVTTAQTASFVAWANVQETTTDTFLGTSSYSTFALTASYAMNAAGGSVPANTVSSSAQLSVGGGTAFTSSNNVIFGSITGSVDALINDITFGRGSNNKATNTAVGSGSLRVVTAATTVGIHNVAVGANALQNNTSGSQNVAVGSSALPVNSVGNYNIGIGYQALLINTSGSSNVAIGNQTLTKVVSGTNSVAVGEQALFNNTTNNNVAVGYFAGKAISTGTENVAIGTNAVATQNATLCVGVGLNTLYGTFGTSNTAVGHYSSFSTTAGTLNATLGKDALYNNVTGSQNVAVGALAGKFITDGATANTNASSSIYIGYNVRPLLTGQQNQIIIGSNVNGLGNNTTIIGNSSTTQTYLYGNISGSNAAIGSITGSLQGTSSYAAFALTASYALTGGSGGTATISLDDIWTYGGI